jgi:hypothetical protein
VTAIFVGDVSFYDIISNENFVMLYLIKSSSFPLYCNILYLMCGREVFILILKRSKIVNISTYKRKRQLRKKKIWVIKNKAWVITIMSVVGLSSSIWFFKGDPSSNFSNPNQINYDKMYPNLYSMPHP